MVGGGDVRPPIARMVPHVTALSLAGAWEALLLLGALSAPRREHDASV